MIRAGDSVVNPVTGERLVFHRTSEETGGEYCRFEVYIEPGGAVAAAHVHPFQTGLAMGAPRRPHAPLPADVRGHPARDRPE